jgi:hypothetical protein
VQLVGIKYTQPWGLVVEICQVPVKLKLIMWITKYDKISE